MTVPVIADTRRVDEPRQVQDYADVLSEVAAKHAPVIVRRDGADLAAVIPLEHLELLHEIIAQLEAERLAALIDWDTLVKKAPPPQSWFEGDEPKPF